MDESIGVVLTGFRRPWALAEQRAALAAQSVPPSAVWLWINGEEFGVPPNLQFDVTVRATPNLGVWPRFLLGLEMSTEFVCIFDDDTIPGRRWLENCLRTIKTCGGAVGAVGVKVPVDLSRGYRILRYGWPNPNPDTMEVDVLGHAWFVRRSWLRAYAAEPRCGNQCCGEDYHLGVALQRQLGRGCYVPPHPTDDKELWGSIKPHYGNSKESLWRQRGQKDRIIQMAVDYQKAGWQVLEARCNAAH